MPRDIPVANGNLLVAFDRLYRIRDLTFPFVGQENHTAGEPFRLGVWADGAFSWVDERWSIRLDYLDDTLVTRVEILSPDGGLGIESNDAVDFEADVFLRRMTVEDRSGRRREVRVFFHHDFHIFGTIAGDTANYQPDTGALFHFKERRCFFVNAMTGGRPGFRQFATGGKEMPGKEGTWRDAEDGTLSGNPIAQGAVDSVGAVHVDLEPGGKATIYYWICAATDWHGASALNALVVEKTPEALLVRTEKYWRYWVDKEGLNYDLLPAPVARLYKRSLLVARTHVDARGGIVAAVDSDAFWFNRDSYAYVWPRDGALVAAALDRAGYSDLARGFYEFCARAIHGEGYFLHKYTPSGAEGSSWHPWFDPATGQAQLPIQEDEVAVVVWALWNHFALYRDIDFIRPLYEPLVVRAARFMLGYRDRATGLPLPSYDLWEERRGILTYTTAAVFAGLSAAGRFAEAFSEDDLAAGCRRAADEMRTGLFERLWIPEKRRFARMIVPRPEGGFDVDDGLDASLFGVVEYGAVDARDERAAETMRQVREKLWCGVGTGGLARYEGDAYSLAGPEIPGNPWIITTLWLARYLIKRSSTRRETDDARSLLEWAAGRALPSGVLPEQVDRFTGGPLSVAPLAWSHGAFVTAVQEYLDKIVDLERCAVCGRPRVSKYRRGPEELSPGGGRPQGS